MTIDDVRGTGQMTTLQNRPTNGTGLVENVVDGDGDMLPCHKDARPWKKSCQKCIFRRGNPQGLTEAEWKIFAIELAMPDYEFYCEHRSDDGQVRKCASHIAIERGKTLRGE